MSPAEHHLCAAIQSSFVRRDVEHAHLTAEAGKLSFYRTRIILKTFLGTSANALKTQIWTALIAMLFLKYLQMKSSFGWPLSNLAALLRQQLFIFRYL